MSSVRRLRMRGSSYISEGGGHLVLDPKLLRVATGSANFTGPSAAVAYPYVRKDSVIDFLAITPLMVDPGKRFFNWLKTSPNAANKAEDTSLAALTVDAAILQPTEMTPTRTVAVRGYTEEAGSEWEDIASLLRDDAMSAIRDQLQGQILNGDTNAPNFSGLFGTAVDKRSTGATADAWNTVAGVVESLVDGRWASSMADLRLVAHSKTGKLHRWLLV